MKTWSEILIGFLTLIVLTVTALFIIKYWGETQAMKNEMITQNRISSQALKSSLLPVLDVHFERVKAHPEMGQFEIQFAYDIIVENKGNGPAFNVILQRLILPEKNRQKQAVRPAKRRKLGQFIKSIHMIGRGERVNIHREHSDSYEYVRIKVTYKDHFKDFQKCIFEGDRDGLRLIDYPVLEDYENTKPENIIPSVEQGWILLIDNLKKRIGAFAMNEVLLVFSAIGAVFAAFGAWRAASATKKAKMADLFFQFVQDYASKEMLNSLRILRDWKENHGPGFEIEWLQALREDGSGEHEAAYLVDIARRRVKFHYYTLLRSLERHYVDKGFLEDVGSLSGINLLYEVVEPLEQALDRSYDPSFYEKLKQLCPPIETKTVRIKPLP